MIERPRSRKPERRPLSRTAKIMIAMVIIIATSIVVRLYFAIPYRISDSAMKNGLFDGDCVWVSKAPSKMSVPNIGELILFEHPLHPGENLVRRVIATEGQKVEIKEKKVYIDDKPFAELATVTHSDYKILPKGYSNRDFFAPQRVPSGQVLVLGDNRDDSDDSRTFGFVPVSSISGKGLFVYFSWKPDPKAPKMESPYITPALHILFYNLVNFTGRVRWNRLMLSAN